MQTTQPTVAPDGQRLERESVMTDRFDGDDYNLRVLIERWSGCTVRSARSRQPSGKLPSFPRARPAGAGRLGGARCSG